MSAQPALRAVLLGASNVSFALRTWVARLRAASGGPVEVLAACGNGRSYGEWSRFLYVRRLPGIAGCGIWEALGARPALPTVALLADVGNDILYEEQPEQIAEWVGACCERLAAHGARTAMVLGSMPVIEAVGPLRYLALRTLAFPCRTLPYEPARRRALALDALLRDLAAARGVPLVVPEPSWYAIDPIHIRHGAWPAMCDGALAAWGLPCAPARQSARLGARPARRGLPGFPFAHEVFCGRTLRTQQPALAFADGTTIAWY